MATAALSWRGALTHPLFAGIREDRADKVLRELVPRPVRAGRLLNAPGAVPAYLHLVITGRLQIYRLNSSGHQLVLEIIQAGGIDGILTLAGQSGHFTQAMTDSLVVSITPRQLQRLREAEPRIGDALLALSAARLEAREEQMESMAARGVQGLARLLITLGRTLGHKEGARLVLEFRLTHQMLADMLGVRRETVAMQLPHLVRSGVVRVEAGHLTLDPAGLQGFAEPIRRRRTGALVPQMPAALA
ncbi:MAG: Crp/Fnr family transcriptional regulator [Actinomycetota bacterium]|nr:Crp/Fnr family transcriptional regulator [Actinomycetota bacterium]